jgi:hypothetical protein
LLRPDVTVLVDFDLDPHGQRVDDGDADAVQATRDGVCLAVELATGMQHGQRHLYARHLRLRVDVDRDAAAVVDDLDTTVGQQRHNDLVAEAGEGLVHRVVDNLLDEVVQAALAGGADIHAGSFADGLESFECGNGTCVVFVGTLRRCHASSLSHMAARRGVPMRGWRGHGRRQEPGHPR